ncbi:hypothetical protein [Ancylobacter pratisalsi]|uniref:DUF2291 domain-containing protein n=1 Tax=Ancylobacter pratisalsi TaxID=1745854 RepID=A0A6P1YSG2_9HYPH|nr:hypothetical protein [Ancylobacter pratisalsi]QIB35820.1 hypothetical protein G3A50_20470 [Ancylobacter pratisalsi]
MNIRTQIAAVAAAMTLVSVAPSFAQDEAPHVKPVTAYVQKNVEPWLNNPVIIAAIIESNKKHARLMQTDINDLDAKWKAKDQALRDSTMKNDAAAFLVEKKDASGGVITEAFVMDNRGLNVAQTDGTSDMWQADEAKWQKTYGVGPGTIFVDKVEEDGGKQIAQVSVTISDKDKAVGAITIGIDVDKLK